MRMKTRLVCQLFGSFVLFSGLLLMIVLLSLSVNKEVEQDEYMLTMNKYTGELGNVHEQGRVNLAIGDEMIKFKRTVKTYSSRISCWSVDQLLITADVTVYYQYIKDFLKPIIMIDFYDEDYFNQFFYSKIKGSIISTCGNYTAESFYQDRAAIANRMFLRLVELNQNQNLTEASPVSINQLQLQNLQFPVSFNNILNTKSQTRAQQQTQINARQTLLTNAQTNLIAARQQAAILLIQANQQSNQFFAQANATKAIIIDQFQKRAIAFNEAKNRLNLDDQSLLNYVRGEMIRSNNNTVMAI